MKYKLFGTMTLILLFCLLNAQENYQDVVYLKNGSIIKGMIIEQVPNKTLKIQTADGNLFVYTYDEIEKITKEQKKQAESTELKESQSSNSQEKKAKWGYDVFRMGALIGDGMTLFSLNGVFGIKISNQTGLGLGIGWDSYPNGTMIPIFMEGRSQLGKGQICPIFCFGAGYSLGNISGSDSWDVGGIMAVASVGAAMSISKSSSLSFEIGYKLQMSKEQTFWGDENVDFNFLTLMAGFCF